MHAGGFLVRLVPVGAIVLLLAACGAGNGSSTDVGVGAPTTASSPSRPADGRSFQEVCGDAPPETYCGVTEAELHALNMRYADRLDFAGHPTRAAEALGAVRLRLAPLVATTPDPSESDVRAALDGLGSVQTSLSAVRTAGLGFAVQVAGGCVFGSIDEGALDVNVGGYINDGGCLASYGH